MIYTLFNSDTRALIDEPETGMGYQVILARETYTNYSRKFIVYNAELAVEFDNNFESNKNLIIREGFQNIVNKSQKILLAPSTIIVLDESAVKEVRTISAFKEIIKSRHSGGKGATDSVKEYANGTEIFVRISAYEDDKRVDIVNNKLKEGSFTTTEKDYLECVRTNDDPIDRYALPNDEEIKWSFYFQPRAVDILQRGIVQPAFSHDGGGIETYFQNGTSNNTLLSKRAYGK